MNKNPNAPTGTSVEAAVEETGHWNWNDVNIRKKRKVN